MPGVQGFSGDSKGAGYNDMSAPDVLAICLRRRENEVWCRGEEGSKSATALFKKVSGVPLDKLACLRVPRRFLERYIRRMF